MKPNLDFESDHRLLLTTLATPKDKKSRWKPRSPLKQNLNIKLLAEHQYQSDYNKKSVEEIRKWKCSNISAAQISENLVKSLTNAASEVLPNNTRKNIRQLWKDDQSLNRLLEERAITVKDSADYKRITKFIKSLIRKLKQKNSIVLQQSGKLKHYIIV